jgi:hypothetical protein
VGVVNFLDTLQLGLEQRLRCQIAQGFQFYYLYCDHFGSEVVSAFVNGGGVSFSDFVGETE